MNDTHPSNPHGDEPTRREDNLHRESQVGPYRLLEKLGEGAMGEVWRAEQREPIKRIVALKILKRGLDTREVITRFEIERQAMALMDHPWIAKVHDAGETDRGRPYIALEYVPGEKITEYCARVQLGIDERLKLFQKVCLAVQHAHQRAVIHRDLKPSNILVIEVDGQPAPKIIDFGIAKATAQRLTDRSAATFIGQLVGTPLYMSPEQVEMSAAGVDTRADVYSLGVVLYELLSGALPHDPQRLATCAFDEVLKILREDDPDRPSTKVSTLGDRTVEIAAQRGLDAKKLAGKLKGDLDWITLKALEKDRKRRYETPQHLVEDIDRYLEFEAIEARPPSSIYRTSRFVRRHRVGVGVGAVALVVLIGFTIWQAHQSRVIAGQRDLAMANERLALARENIATDPTVAIAYALSSLELRDQPSAREVVRRAMVSGPIRDEIPRLGGSHNPFWVDAAPDGRTLAVLWPEATGPFHVGIYDLEASEQRLLEVQGSRDTSDLKFNRDGSYLALALANGVHLWRLGNDEHRFLELDDGAHGAVTLHAVADPLVMLASTTDVGRRTEWHRIDLGAMSMRSLGLSRGFQHEGLARHQTGANHDGTRIVDFDGREVFLQDVADFGSDRVQEVGHHDALVCAVAGDADLGTVVSADISGVVRVWDTGTEPSTLLREFRDSVGELRLEVDPYQSFRFAVFFSATAHLYDFRDAVPKAPLGLLDRTHWTYDGAFLPDGSLVTSRIALSLGPLARWRRDPVQSWFLDVGDSVGTAGHVRVAADGRTMLVWMTTGALLRVPLGMQTGESAELVARTTTLDTGWPFGFFLAEDGRCALTDSQPSGARLIDLESGTTQSFDDLAQTHLAVAMTASGQRACFEDLPDGVGEDAALRIMNLERMEVEAVLNSSGTQYFSYGFAGEDSLVALAVDHAVVFDIRHPDATPATVWEGDARMQGIVLDHGRALVTRGADSELILTDLISGEVRPLGRSQGNAIMTAEYDRTLGLCAVSGWWTATDLYDLRSGRRSRIPFAENRGSLVTLDPRGRWMIEARDEGCIARALPPDPLFQDLESEDFIARVRALTNVRVAPSVSIPGGFVILTTGETFR